MLSRALMMMSLETLKISFALDIKLFGESVSRDIGTEGGASTSLRRGFSCDGWLHSERGSAPRALRTGREEGDCGGGHTGDARPASCEPGDAGAHEATARGYEPTRLRWSLVKAASTISNKFNYPKGESR